MLGLAIVLLSLVAVATYAKLFLVFRDSAVHLSDSYWGVGIAHGLLGGPVLVFFAWWGLPTHRSRATAWLYIATGVVLVAATILDLALGLYGMPTRYFKYLPEFQGWHVAAGVAWLAFMVLFLATIALSARHRVPAHELA